MKSLVSICLIGLCLSGSFVVVAQKGGASSPQSLRRGYPPHGYPCLGCAPCPGNPTEYCSTVPTERATGGQVASSLTPHPDAVDLGYVFAQNKMIPLATFFELKSVKSTMKEWGGYLNPTGEGSALSRDRNPNSVKCACGTDVWGKDKDACNRICDFLKSQNL